MSDVQAIVVSEVSRQIDTLAANEFAVEIDGERVSGVFRVVELVTFKLDVKPSLTKYMQEPFKIVKMLQRDPHSSFNRWVRETIAARDDIAHPKRQLAIVAIDDGVETRRWVVKGAWISEIRYSDFNSGSAELVEETLLIRYDDIEVVWAGI
jgi:hypothetical protein